MSDSGTPKSTPLSGTLDFKIEDIFFFFKRNLLLIMLSTLAAGLLGYLSSYAFTKIFQSQITLLPEYGNAGKKSSLAFLASGINSEGAEKLMPDLYPTILESSEFGIYLLKKPVVDQNNIHYKSLDSYFKSTAEKGLFGGDPRPEAGSTTNVKLDDPNILQLSLDQYRNIKYALSLVSATIDQKLGIITIKASTKDPVVSSILAEAAKTYLIQYVEEYRTARASQQAELLKKQAYTSKQRLSKAEYSLQSYRDRNRGAYLNVAKIEEQRLQSEYLLAQSLYDDLSRRYEQAIIKIREEKPVFKVLEPSQVSNHPSKPRRLFFAAFSLFFGFILSLLYIILIKDRYLQKYISATKRM